MDVTGRELLTLNMHISYEYLRISGPALRKFIADCPNIDMEKVSYCDYTQDGPDPTKANGCQNTECDIRICCSNYQN